MSQIENHWAEIKLIETELMRKMIALGVRWEDDEAMKILASECMIYSPADAQAAYASHDFKLITKAELFALAFVMTRTMESAALEDREVHGGEVWKAFGKHLYSEFPNNNRSLIPFPVQ